MSSNDHRDDPGGRLPGGEVPAGAEAAEERDARALAEALDVRLGLGGAGEERAGSEAAEVPALLGVANLVRDGLRARVMDDVTRRRLRNEIVAEASAAAAPGISGDGGESVRVSGRSKEGVINGAASRRRGRAFIGSILAVAAAFLLVVTGNFFMGKAPSRSAPDPTVRAELAAATPHWPLPPVPRGLVDPAEKPAERLGAKMNWGLSTLRENEFQALRARYLASGKPRPTDHRSAVALRIE